MKACGSGRFWNTNQAYTARYVFARTSRRMQSVRPSENKMALRPRMLKLQKDNSSYDYTIYHRSSGRPVFHTGLDRLRAAAFRASKGESREKERGASGAPGAPEKRWRGKESHQGGDLCRDQEAHRHRGEKVGRQQI